MCFSGWHRRPPPAAAAAPGLIVLATIVALAVAGRHPARDRRPIVTTAHGLTAPTAAAPTAPIAVAGAAPTSPATSPPDPAERVAAAFVAGYLTFHWSDDTDAIRRRCRPWDTDEVDAALAGPGVPRDRARRAAGRETDGVQILAVDPQDDAGDHLDASVAAAVTIARPGQAGQTDTEVIDVRVVATSGGWLVAQVSQ
jgi:hypothetical protein